MITRYLDWCFQTILVFFKTKKSIKKFFDSSGESALPIPFQQPIEHFLTPSQTWERRIDVYVRIKWFQPYSWNHKNLTRTSIQILSLTEWSDVRKKLSLIKKKISDPPKYFLLKKNVTSSRKICKSCFTSIQISSIWHEILNFWLHFIYLHKICSSEKNL